MVLGLATGGGVPEHVNWRWIAWMSIPLLGCSSRDPFFHEAKLDPSILQIRVGPLTDLEIFSSSSVPTLVSS